jgi:glycosyltransferase involved in cell wall biosynthesis
MKVMHWAFPFHPSRGGQSIFIEQMAIEFASRGHEVSLLTRKFPESELIEVKSRLENRVDIIQVDLDMDNLDSKSGTSFREVAKRIENFSPDVIHVHNLDSRELAYLRLYLNTRGRKILTLCTIHDLVTLKRARALIDRNLFTGFLDFVVAPSDFIYQKLAQGQIELRDQIMMVYNGVTPLDKNRNSKKGSHQLRLLFAAELHEHKGGILLLTAWAKIFKTHPEVTLVIAGDGDAKDFLHQYARSINFGDQLEFLGWLSRSELEDELAGNCVLIVPSMIGEAFGLVVAEAAMAQTPAIVNAVGALPELVQDGVTGIVVIPGDTQSLSRAMETLILNEELRNEMGLAAQKRTLELFALDGSASQYEQLIMSRLDQDRK